MRGISIQTIESALTRRIRQNTSTALAPDSDLATVARKHVDSVDENSSLGGDTNSLSLADRLEQHQLAIGSYQTYTLKGYPSGQTADAVADELYTEFLTGFPDSGREFTHVGVGACWVSNRGVQASIIAAKRLVQLPGDLNPDQLEQAVHAATNDRRVEHGYDSLSYDTHLASIARSHSRAMATQEFFAHTTPDGKTAMDRYKQADYESRRAGENISKRYPATTTPVETIANDVVKAWMDSPGHRENILKKAFSREGIGVYQGADGALFVTQNFS